MADEKQVAEKKPAQQEPGKGAKFVAWCKALPAKIAKPFKNMWYELKKVTWPTKRRWLVSSAVVLVFMLAMAVVIGLFDMGSSALVTALGRING